MSKNVTMSVTPAQAAMIAAFLNAMEPAVVEAPKAKKSPKGKKAAKKAMPEGLKAARAHCRDAREVRWNSTPLGGLTKAQRQEIAATLREAGKDVSNARTWNAAVKKFKAGGFR